MIKQIILIAAFALAIGESHSQQTFFPTIKVQFEKTISVRALYKDLEENSSWFQQSQERYPVSVVSTYEFIGDTTHSIYRPSGDAIIDPRAFYRPIADKNIIYNDYRTKTTISQKPVFEETFLMTDSLPKIKWKITGDIRNIAGYDCRKAVGILDDSIAVFAFYSEELMVNGGPENISGLPGMILGMGVPRLHATWFATKVEVFNVNMKPVTPATKGKKVNRVAMLQSLNNVIKRWGTYGGKMIIHFQI
jgi:GLPGLI family protein